MPCSLHGWLLFPKQPAVQRITNKHNTNHVQLYTHTHIELCAAPQSELAAKFYHRCYTTCTTVECTDTLISKMKNLNTTEKKSYTKYTSQSAYHTRVPQNTHTKEMTQQQ